MGTEEAPRWLSALCQGHRMQVMCDNTVSHGSGDTVKRFCADKGDSSVTPLLLACAKSHVDIMIQYFTHHTDIFSQMFQIGYCQIKDLP